MRFIFYTHLVLISIFNLTAQNKAYEIFVKSTQVINSAKNMTYSNMAKERINGIMLSPKLAHIKVQRKPYKLYLKQERKEGAEILFNSNITTKTALVNPGKFPYINLNLNPNGSIMHKNEHHTILQADIKYTYDIVNHSLKTKQDIKKMSYINMVRIKEKTYHKIKLTNFNYKITTYKVQKNDNINNIAKKLYLNDYSIYELNKNISNNTDIKIGEIIKVPTHYAKSMIMYINTQNYLPYKILVYDYAGLYESYEFKNLKINVEFKENEFLKSFEEYDF